MAIRKNQITDAWTPITNAGQSGTCWVVGKPGRGQVVLNHSDAGTGGLEVNESYFMIGEKRNTIIDITADNASDIFYAKCVETGAEVVLISDVV